MTPSSYQLEIFKHLETTDRSLVIKALAGTGKTTVLVEALKRLPDRKGCLFVAFNKSIQLELAKRCPKDVDVKTLHSLGFSVVMSRLGRVSVDGSKVSKLARLVIDNMLGGGQIKATGWRQRGAVGAVARTVSLAKNLLIDKTADLANVAEGYGLADETLPAAEIAQVAAVILGECLEPQGEIDFDDMIWLPAVNGWQVKRYQTVFVDECLPYHTPVMLADGTSKPIGEIVDTKLGCEVLAFDTATGEQRSCRVTGWQKIPNRKPLVKIKARWSKKGASGNRPTNFVVCTVDHKIWANGRWIAAGEIKPGDVIQVETAAAKSSKYKIAAQGKRHLARLMTAKNTAGVMACGRNTNTNPGGPVIRGGNGRGLTVPQKMLLAALPEGWVAEHAVSTKMARDSGYPPCYKLDLAFPDCKVGVELDGATHKGARALKDAKKDQFLESLGWQVIRIPNIEAVQKTEKLANELSALANCPLDAVVTSVESTTIKDYFVYDITVDDCHNFYANGILVHNCQDLNPAQLYLIKSASRNVRNRPPARIVAVGDDNQCIYQFRGAGASGGLDALAAEFNADILTLPVTYRCGSDIVDAAKKYVPNYYSADPCTGKGSVRSVAKLDPKPGDFVLSRKNAPLIGACLDLLSRGIPATVLGRDVGNSVVSLIEKLAPNPMPCDQFLTLLNDYEARQRRRLADDGDRLSLVTDQIACARVLAEHHTTTGAVVAWIRRMFQDIKQNGNHANPYANRVTCSSVHKAKGLEADRVWMLTDTFNDRSQAEKNLSYVAITRAKSELLLVASPAD